LKHHRWPAIAVVSATLVALISASGGSDRALQPYHADGPRLFQTADACISCHNGVTAPSGEDVSIGSAWRATMMANSARDPYWQASVRRELLDHPKESKAIEDECSTCHMPMARTQAHADGRQGEVFAHLPVGQSEEPDAGLAADGVSCTLCHQILETQLGRPESFNGGFVVDVGQPWRKRPVFGPFDIDEGRALIMHSSSEFRPMKGAHVQKSELCATCHTLYTNARDASGKIVGRLPEQVPFLEWKHSDYSRDQSCQSCHMPVVPDSAPVSGVLGLLRSDVSRHDFRGGNFFMLSMLNRYRSELGVEALPQELDAATRRTVAHLQTETARVAIAGAQIVAGRLRATLIVRNLGGHKLPTAYPSRRVWLHLTVQDGSGKRIFESGAINPNGSIVGNDNDADASAFEPHYREITEPDQVQIYESIMSDVDGRVTTGLLSAVRFVKDNRILPTGFDKSSASPDIAVLGEAAADADFGSGGDQVRVSVDLHGAKGPLQLHAELVFQPIAFRWARNLATRPAPETTRFVSYYDAMAKSSSVVMARDSALAK
jgi:hypothetical protein